MDDDLSVVIVYFFFTKNEMNAEKSFYIDTIILYSSIVCHSFYIFVVFVDEEENEMNQNQYI